MKCVALFALSILGFAVVAQAHGGPRLETTGEGASQYRLQTKINWVDTSKAPLIRIYASVLDGRFKSVNFDDVQRVSVISDEGEEGKRKLVTFDREQERVVWHELFADARADDAPPAQMVLAEEQAQGLAAVIVANGYDGTIDESAPGYRDSEAGARILGGVGLFLKQLSQPSHMNVVWYGDDVKTWINASGRHTDLTTFSPNIQQSCAKTRRERLERTGFAEASADAPADDDEVFCGLTPEVDKLIALFDSGDNLFEGAYPNLFGLDWRPFSSPQAPGDFCKQPEIKRRVERQLREDDDSLTPAALSLDSPWPSSPSAIELALSMLVRDAAPDQPRALIILSDGKDGYVHRLRECKTQWRSHGECRALAGKAKRECVTKWLKKDIAREQARFLPKAERWIALAKAAGIRIFTVIHPAAESYERERLQILSFKTGGTARVAETVSELDGAYADLIDEINGQLVLSFIDENATPEVYQDPDDAAPGGPGSACERAVDCDARQCVAGACQHSRRYQLEVEVGFPNKKRRKVKSGVPFIAAIAPSAPLSAAGLYGRVQSSLEARLGPMGTMALLIGLGLILGLFLVRWAFGRMAKAKG